MLFLFYAYAKLWTGFSHNNTLSNSFMQNNGHKLINQEEKSKTNASK